MHRPAFTSHAHRGACRKLAASALPCNGVTRRPLTTAAATAACPSNMVHAVMQPSALKLRLSGGAMHLVRAAQPRRGVVAHAGRKPKVPASDPQPESAQQAEGEAEAEEYEEEEYMEDEEGEYMEDEEGEVLEDEQEDNIDYEAELQAMSDVDMANSVFGIPGMVEFSEGENGLPRVFLKHPYCESGAEVYMHGATVTQWLRPDGEDALPLRPDVDFSGTAPIESGVGLFFPQYRSGGVMDKGFANNMQWQLIAAGLDFLPVGDGFTEPHSDDEEPETSPSGGEEGAEAGSSSSGDAGAGGASASAADSGRGEGASASSGSGRAEEEGLGAGEAGASQDEDGGQEEEEEEEADDMWDELVPRKLNEYASLIRDQMNQGLDPAPYITLRLTDTDATRQLWPHKFEVLYKITLMETDDFEELTPVPEQETFSSATSPTIITAAMETKALLMENVDNLEDDDLELDPELRHDPRLMPSAIDKNEDYAVPLENQPRKTSLQEREEGVRDPELDATQVPLQLRLEVKVFNRDEQGSKPMEFQVGHLAHIATRDQRWHGDFIKLRGLGGSNLLDYTEDRTPVLNLCQDDYINFWGQRVDATFVNAADADVAITPGDGTHFELLAREGHRDVMVYHPGTLEGGSKEDAEAARKWVGLGAGRLMTPVKLAPGDEWYSCFKLRFHNRVWKEPVWGEDGMYPLDPIPKAMLANVEDGDEEQDEQQEGGPEAAEEEPSFA